MAKSKRFLALARVSSREQEREGFSLDVQEKGLEAGAERRDGKIVKLFRIAETASKKDERKTFKELLAYAKKNAAELDGILFYKIDRACRNLPDYVELEKLESEYNLPFISITQPTESSPAGRMQRRMLANMAAFFTEQQSVDVREGQAQRVKTGLFVGTAPYGYLNVRIEGRGLVDVSPENGPKIQRVFHLYAYENHTLDSLIGKLAAEGIFYLPSMPRWNRSTLGTILSDRSYIGEVWYQGNWYPGTHKPLVDRVTFDRVQVLLGEKTYKSHNMTYAGELITCAHCGRAITGETITKKATGKEYIYYRCVKYKSAGHPSVRLTEKTLDKQILALFAKIKLPDDIRDWFRRTLMAWCHDHQAEARTKVEELQRQLTSLRNQQDRLLNLRLVDEIDESTFASKNTELRDRIATCKLQVDAADRGQDEQAELALKVFELSQSLADKWLIADCSVKRQILQMVCLNLKLEGATLVPTMRKPFDVLIEGLSQNYSRGDRI